MPVKITMALHEQEHAYIEQKANEFNVSNNAVIRAMIRDMSFLEERAPEDGTVHIRNPRTGELSEMCVGSLRTPKPPHRIPQKNT